jgi:DNA-binding NarL/FixJ family response regulator
MSEQVTLALIVAPPGPLRNSLQALLTTMPQIEILAETSDPSALLRMGAEIQPHVVLMDADLPEVQVCAALDQIKTEWSKTRSVVLVKDSEQQQVIETAGADAALIKGCPAAELISTIEDLLSQQEDGATCACPEQNRRAN